MKIDLIILASGFSSRFHENKLLYPLHKKPIIQYVFDAIKLIGFHHIYVITQYDEIMELAKQNGIHSIYNNKPEMGMSYSIKLGVQANTTHDGLMFMTADIPYITTSSIQTMYELADDQHIICAKCNGVIQNPMLFPKCYDDELLTLTQDDGGKKIAKQHINKCVFVSFTAKELKDIDTKEDLP